MKTQRQAKIMEIITSRNIETQEQLLEALQQSGYQSNPGYHFPGHQGTAHCQRTDAHGQLSVYGGPRRKKTGTFSNRLNTIFRECVTHYDYAQNMVGDQNHARAGQRRLCRHRRHGHVGGGGHLGR